MFLDIQKCDFVFEAICVNKYILKKIKLKIFSYKYLSRTAPSISSNSEEIFHVILLRAGYNNIIAVCDGLVEIALSSSNSGGIRL